jgi:mediator of RNA polymerase II transcription subunit 14
MNGNLSQGAADAASMGTKKALTVGESRDTPVRPPEPLSNGTHQGETNGEIQAIRPNSPLDLSELPLEVRHGFQGAFMPLSKLIRRAVQHCWKDLSDMVDDLASTPLRSHPSDTLASGYMSNGVATNDQSKSNLDKKERLLNITNDQKAIFIKLLVMLQWSRDAEAVSKALQIRFWLHEQRQIYFNAAHQVGMMKRQLASFQVPNPDLRTAGRVLSLWKVPELPDLGYIPPKPLTARQILRTLKSLDRILCSRLALSDDLPSEFQDFRIHDGRVTFSVPTEFELDLTVMDTDFASRFHFLDFRFTFSPASKIPEGSLYTDISVKINDLLARDGLLGCYSFLHDMVLSYKLNLLNKQAVELLRGQYANNLRVELIRRTLVVQYWANRPAPKSWIEIGIKSGRQKKGSLSPDHPKSYLHIRWMRELKEVEDAEIVLDPATLSMDCILRQIIASHTSHIFDLVYDKLMVVPPYADGELLVEQTYSSTEPSDCRLKLQLTKTKPTVMAIEPVTGSLILSPASSLSSRFEYDMRQAKNLAEDVPQKLSHLRCAVAEHDLIKTAESTGWDIVRTFKASQAEIKSLFSESVLRVVFLRQPYWESEYMVAATLGPNGDYWWLLQRRADLANAVSWTSQRIDSRPMHAEDAVSYQYLARLENYTSRMIALRTNAAYAASVALRFVLKPMPRFEGVYQLPRLLLDFQSAKLRSSLSMEAMTTDLGSNLTPMDQRQPKSWIQRSINVTYYDFDRKSSMAVMIAQGQSSASRKVLQQLADSALNPPIHISPKSKRFSIRLYSPVGKPIIEELLRHLSHLENIMACLSVAQEHRSLSVVSLSTSHLSLRYLESSETTLGFTVHFASPTSPVRMELWPRESNPHILIAAQLTEVLANPRRSLPMSLRLLIPLLTFTLPLLSFLQKLATSGDHGPTVLESTSLELHPRLHVMPRHATMYGIQYFAPPGVDPVMPANSEGSPRMLARLEILPCQRRKQSYWILRPAIEEFESYTRPSFPMPDISDKLKEEIFSRTGEENGWIALDQGAACPLDKPERLLQALHDLITKWLREGPLSGGEQVVENGVTEAAVEPTIKLQPGVNAQTRSQPPLRVQTTGIQNPKTKPVAAVGKGNTQKKQEVIQLD